MSNITMRQMLEAGVHFGHKAAFWNPDMAPYIFGTRQKLHIINLEKTLPMFRQALSVVDSVAKNRGRILFVGTKFAARDVVREEAIRCGMPYVDYRWLGGMMTNYKTIRVSVKRLKELERLFEQSQIVGYTKKEVLNLMREKDKLSLTLSGIKNMGGLPDAIFVIDVNTENIAVKEAKRLGIPVIGVVDTNSSPNDIDYIIPGNDDAMRAVRFYCSAVANTIIEARGVLKLTDEALKAEKVKAEAAKKAAAKKKIEPKVVAKKEEPVDSAPVAPVKKVVKKTTKVASKDEDKSVAKKPAAKKPAAKKAATKKAAAKKETKD